MNTNQAQIKKVHLLTTIINRSIVYRKFIVFLLGAMSLLSIYALFHSPLDAIPDISDRQIIVYSKWSQSPSQLESKITQPIIRSLSGLKGVRTLRGMSYLGYSFIYVILESNTDREKLKARVKEILNSLKPDLPKDARIDLGADASGMGWIFQYALVNQDSSMDLREIRLIQEERIKRPLETVKGVAEVATVGGLKKQYQLKIYPQLLSATGISLKDLVNKLETILDEAGGRVLEVNNRDYQIRGSANVGSIDQVESLVIGHSNDGQPVLIKDIGYIQVGYDQRRGIADLNGEGEVVGGIVIIEQDKNVLRVKEQIAEKLAQIQSTLPKNLKIVTVYDRSILIWSSITTFFETLGYELVVVVLVIVIFLRNFRAVSAPLLILLLGTLFTAIPLYFFHQTLNLFSIAGLFIAMGEMADASIVMLESCISELALNKTAKRKKRQKIILGAVLKMARPLFFSLLIIVVSFLPILFLGPMEGKVFNPLVLSKTFAMFASTLLTFFFLPALLLTLLGGNNVAYKNVADGGVARYYKQMLKFIFNYKFSFLFLNFLVLFFTLPILFQFEKEFMPELDENSILYMPTTLPGLPTKEAGWILQQIDKKLKKFPEVKTVFGKLGRADTATDPAPFTMIETTITLHPKQQWREGMNRQRLLEEMNREMRVPGFSNAWTQPIRGRIDMQSTGIASQVGVKIYGPNIHEIEVIAKEVETLLAEMPGTRSVIAERISDGYFIDTQFDIEKLARWGLPLDEALLFVKYALSGENVASIRQEDRWVPLNLQYAVDYIDTVEKISHLKVILPDKKIIPLSEIAKVEIIKFPEMVRNENGLLTGYLYIETLGTNAGEYVQQAKTLLTEKLKLKKGYHVEWAGQFLHEREARERLLIIIPITLLLIFVLLKLTFKSTLDSILLIFSIPFAMVGGVWLQWGLGYPMTVAVWVGYIALFAVAVQTGIIMVVFIHQALKKSINENIPQDRIAVENAIIEGSVFRLRPKLMTVATTFFSLLPIMIFSGSGLEIMKPIAVPTIGGIITSTFYVLFLIPCLYAYKLELHNKTLAK
jgi:Cu(I)/Ag(I) efflux system membrane protein CusA/SilA